MNTPSHWTAVLTTAPRRDPTVHLSIESLRHAGLEPIVFAEPDSPATDALTYTAPTRLGVWHNWLRSAHWALDNTSAAYILTVQDDALLHPDSQAFLSALPWPNNAAFVSLYTPRLYSFTSPRQGFQPLPPGLRRIHTRSLWGALALVWERSALAAALAHPLAASWLGAKPRRYITVEGRRHRRTRPEIEAIYQHRRQDPATIANSDTAIGKLCNAIQRPMYFVDPSAVCHLAKFSSITNHGGNTGNRQAHRIADFDRPLFNQVFPTGDPTPC